MGCRQYTLRLRCEPKSLQPACTKFSNFVPILDTSHNGPDLVFLFTNLIFQSEVIKVRVVTIDVSSIGIKFENFMQVGAAGIKVHTLGAPCTAKSQLVYPNWYSFLEHF